MNSQRLCLALVRSETEDEVVHLLKDAGYWDDPLAWRNYGDNENNFATIGNQQSRPEVALVEKIINSVDATLMAECLRQGIDPTSLQAPQSIKEAQEHYFGIRDGELINLTSSERSELGELINVVATGSKRNPCYAVIDWGEGQSPARMPETLLSLNRSNKLRIPFVQGKFNMGGTGVLQFCGQRNLQLIVSKRHPEIARWEKYNDPSVDLWGFTIVRREDPTEGMRSSVYRYLAPGGNVLTFLAQGLPVLPGRYPNAYERMLEWGTYIKLYEYQMEGYRAQITFDLYYRLSLLVPSLALPVRLYERRPGYDRTQGPQSTLAGLVVRLEDPKNRDNLLEPGFPTSATISVQGEHLGVTIYAFQRGALKQDGRRKRRAAKYKKDEGVLFTVNGQVHGYFPESFFARQARPPVKMGYIADSLLVMVDCSRLSGRAREDLFMNSRDRLREGELRREIQQKLADLLREHQGLKELRNRRRAEDIEGKLAESKPLADVVERIIQKSPVLAKLLIEGVQISNPFRTQEVAVQENFHGERFPSFFRLEREFSAERPKKVPANNRFFRVQYVTDVENEYFQRGKDPGRFALQVNGDPITETAFSHQLVLWNGVATLRVSLPSDIREGDFFHFHSEVMDTSRVDPLVEDFWVEITAEQVKRSGTTGVRNPPSSRNGKDGKTASKLALPNIISVRRDEWERYDFDERSALKVQEAGETGYDFYINLDNQYLRAEMKHRSKAEPRLLEAQFSYGLVLIGMAMLQESLNSDEQGDDIYAEDENVFEQISRVTRAIAPTLLPMIASLGDLELDGVQAVEEELWG